MPAPTVCKIYMAKQILLQLVIEKDEDVFTASCPALPGCISWGKTYDEAYQNIKEAVLCYLEGWERLDKNKYALLFLRQKKYLRELTQPAMVVSLKDAL
ncbi:MAG: hypothetical protein A2445_01920 [Candidatus Jacksonbacteria bacterium RIFOXYC2_FULL_44_29]|nr:MAG: hypothetical protein UV19_C0005G0018 [Parcubacteria group bacterium GW2011_GWA2_42_28]KKT55146.1 MAG: hypothetical protein UW45_C0009G0018 [Parcubacteria group bacterium GW2011_GWC2_44_22]OGY75514.1 MAG: hypothetical protein A2240_03315 [Candidatus Jacksonbacteria bacterium RIFOXYA2_FULL_43_12]OGY75824.1 MAG: hypothetical protein A2295_00115 [Candidatus Jacksonbacteria bacterium RIFOXYB2_FULL_44_15]OGY77884.1 MAG: hypothetical protein A2445_01920 [Candidatus Jacksonbacteria bacterium RI